MLFGNDVANAEQAASGNTPQRNTSEKIKKPPLNAQAVIPAPQ